MPKILYVDPPTDEMRQVLLQHVPPGFELVWPQSDDRFEADYLMVATQPVQASLMNQCTNLVMIQKTGVGVDNIDLEAARLLGIPVANTPGANAIGVAELTILFTLALYRKLPYLDRTTKGGAWVSWSVRSTSYEMAGKTHGFIGFGATGRETALRSQAFGTKILYYDKYRVSAETEKQLGAKYVPLEELLKKADILSIHVTYMKETHHLIGASELSLMKKQAILINVSRGGIVDEEALFHALVEGRIAGAGLDVWENEPVKDNHPLLSLDQVIATPHIGAGTQDTLERVLQTAFDNIVKAHRGDQPDFIVNGVTKLPEKGDNYENSNYSDVG